MSKDSLATLNMICGLDYPTFIILNQADIMFSRIKDSDPLDSETKNFEIHIQKLKKDLEIFFPQYHIQAYICLFLN
jgi:hypothetical protein